MKLGPLLWIMSSVCFSLLLSNILCRCSTSTTTTASNPAPHAPCPRVLDKASSFSAHEHSADGLVVSSAAFDATQRNHDRRVDALLDISRSPRSYKEKYRFELFQPEFNCPVLERIGALGDGGKWMCGVPYLLQHPTCVVYSFGSNGNRVFETALLNMTQHCVIHTFDPNHNYKALYTDPRNTFEPLWLSARPTRKAEQYEGGRRAKVETLEQIMQRLGHDRLDVLKIDVEGAEYEVLKVFRNRPRDKPLAMQIQLETHFPEAGKGRCWDLVKLARFQAYLTEAGYLLFYKEPNPAYPHDAVEWSYIHESALRLPGSGWVPWTLVYNQTRTSFYCASVYSKTKGCAVGDLYDGVFQKPDIDVNVW
eukprot:PhM_4_TR7149/c0_g1_i1/m.78318